MSYFAFYAPSLSHALVSKKKPRTILETKKEQKPRIIRNPEILETEKNIEKKKKLETRKNIDKRILETRKYY